MSQLGPLAVSMLLAWLAFSHCSSGELTLQPEAQVKTLPEDVGQLNSFTFLLCNILPANASVISRWILPNGDVISDRAGRFITAQGDTPTGFSSLLVIQELSYRDAGYYTCEVVPTDECSCSFPPSATTEVQLLVTLSATAAEVSVSEGVAQAVLSCEMRDFIRPDEDLEWYKGDTRIHNEVTPRITIDYNSEGLPHSAQRGSNITVPGRVSTLTVENPTTADSDVYSCRIRGTIVSVDIQLSVSTNGTNHLDLPEFTLVQNSPPLAGSSSDTEAMASLASPVTLADRKSVV